MTQPAGTIRNARVLTRERVTIAGHALDARIIETQAPVASAPYLMRNPDEGTGPILPRVMVAAPAPNAVVIEAEPLETTAVETESAPIQRRRR